MRCCRRLVCVVAFAWGFVAAPCFSQEFRIFHIDVDQGDATLFIAPEGNAMLVDCIFRPRPLALFG